MPKALYTIVFARSARKDLEKLPSAITKQIVKRVETLMRGARPPGATKLQGYKNLWRIRSGQFRVIYSIDDSAHVIDVSAVRNRKDAYRDL